MSLDRRKLENAWARWRAGLPPRGPVVSPEVPNDLFQAHRSFYAFAARFAEGRDVLDLGCGTGYGTADLAAAGAARTVGIDPDERLLSYARRRYCAPSLEFRAGHAERLPDDLGSFGLIAAGNALPHMEDPDAALGGAAALLASGGIVLASVPPILDGQTLARHKAQPSHRSNRYLWEWEETFRRHFHALRLFRCLPPPGIHPDFSSPAASRLSPTDFSYEEIPLADLDDVGGLAAVFLATS